MSSPLTSSIIIQDGVRTSKYHDKVNRDKTLRIIVELFLYCNTKLDKMFEVGYLAVLVEINFKLAFLWHPDLMRHP